MPKLRLPLKFVNNLESQEISDGKLVKRTQVVESSTARISVPFSGPISQSYSEDALKRKKTLTLEPGESREFDQEEANYLRNLYPFLQEVIDESITPSAPAAPALGAVKEELPVNFMQLKKYAVSKGANILQTDKKEDVLHKLSGLKL